MSTTTYVNNVTLSDATEWNRWDTAAYCYLTGVAGTNTITATGPANMTLAAPQHPVVLVPAVTNTGATTLNITPSGGAALTAKNVFCNGVALVAGELKAGVPALLVYDGTQFQIIGPLVSGTIPGALAVTGVFTELRRMASYAWTGYNPTDLAGTTTTAPSTAYASSTATSYATMANSSGTVTYTFVKTGFYKFDYMQHLDVAAANTSSVQIVNLGGSASRIFQPTAVQWDSLANRKGVNLSFVVDAAAAQTLTVQPQGSVISAAGTTADFTFRPVATISYMGVT